MNKVQHSENIDVSRVTLTFELKGNNLNFFYHFFFQKLVSSSWLCRFL